MNKIFFFYPHCYLKSTDDEILVFDTFNRKYVYAKNYILTEDEKETFQKGFLYTYNAHNTFINQCIIKNLGYYTDYELVSPFLYNRKLNIVTSLSKEKQALGYNHYSYTNLLLKEVTVLLNNHKENILTDDCVQLEYPEYNNEYIDIEFILSQLSSFSHIENIILSGEIDNSSLCLVLNYARELNIHVTHRILYNTIEDINSIQLLEEYDNLSIELLVNSYTDVNQINSLKGDNIYIKAIIRYVADIEKFRDLNNITYLPVLSTSHNNIEILNQMILSEREILQSSKSLNDCLISDYINSYSYGHIIIDYDAKVYSMGRCIASLHEKDLPSIINTWVNENTCTWYYSRKKKNTCKNCALQGLCPPISIYEELGLYKCPCKI